MTIDTSKTPPGEKKLEVPQKKRT